MVESVCFNTMCFVVFLRHKHNGPQPTSCVFKSNTLRYYINTGIHTYIHTYLHTYMHACIHTYIHTYTAHITHYTPNTTCYTFDHEVYIAHYTLQIHIATLYQCAPHTAQYSMISARCTALSIQASVFSIH